MSAMDFLLVENLLPAVIAALVIVISWQFWRRKYKSTGGNSRSEPTEVRRENKTAVEKEEDKSEVSFEEATKFLRNAGIIKSGEIQFLPEEERKAILREMTDQPLQEEEKEKKMKELSTKGVTNIQTYYKSSRLGIKEIESHMTKEELDEERETQRKQLEEIFKLLKMDKDKFGVTSMDDLADQMKLYAR